MITITDRDDGHIYHIEYAREGQVLDLMSTAEAEELHAKLADALRPVSTAVTPAKARIMRYPVKADQ